MAVGKAFIVTYQVVKQSNGPGNKYVYRNPLQQTVVVASAASGVAAVLTSDVAINQGGNSGESIEIIDIHEHATSVGVLS